MQRPLVLLLPSLLLAAPLPAEILERIIVKVNGEIITQTEFQSRQLAAAQAARIGPEGVGQFLRENNSRILQEAVDDLLLIQRAQDLGLRLPPEYLDEVIEGIKKENNITSEAQFQEQLAREGMTVDDLRRSIERNIMRRQILGRELEGKVTVTDTEARAEYEKRIADFTTPATVSLLEILVKEEGPDARARGEEILARARAGEDFASLARVYSSSPTRGAGGDLGKLARGDLHPDLEAVAFSLPVGGISDPIPSGDGYRILKVVEKSERSVIPFEQAKEGLRKRLTDERWAQEYEVYMKDLRQQATVDLKVREVPLQLAGPVPSEDEGSLLDGAGDAPAPAAEAAAPASPGTPVAGPPPTGLEDEIVTSGSTGPERVAPPELPSAPAPAEEEKKDGPPPR